MKSYRDLDIYKIGFELSIKVHHLSLKLPKFELYEQGSQVRRSSKSIKNNIVEGFRRRRYKADFIKYLIYSHASCDECLNQVDTISKIYKDLAWYNLITEYESLGKRINKFIQYVENNWRSY